MRKCYRLSYCLFLRCILVFWLLTNGVVWSAEDSNKSDQKYEKVKVRQENMFKKWEDLNKTSHNKWQAKWDKNTGLPRILSGGLSKQYSGKGKDVADVFLKENADLFALSQDIREINLESQTQMPKGERVRYKQVYQGIDVYNSYIDVFTNEDGQVSRVVSSLKPEVNISTTAKKEPNEVIINLQQTESGKNINIHESPRLIIFVEGEEQRLAYRLVVSVDEEWNIWEYVIDAETGDILRTVHLAFDVPESSGSRGK